MITVGIDYSMSSPCVCVHTGDDFSYSGCKFYYLTNGRKYDIDWNGIHGDLHEDYVSDQQRYDNIAKWALSLMPEGARVYMEGYSMGSTGMIFNVAENAGWLKGLMYRRGIGFKVVPPTVIKKFATGKGNANKERLQECFIEETGVDVKRALGMTEKQWNPSSDIIDAYYICKYGHEQEKIHGNLECN